MPSSDGVPQPLDESRGRAAPARTRRRDRAARGRRGRAAGGAGRSRIVARPAAGALLVAHELGRLTGLETCTIWMPHAGVGGEVERAVAPPPPRRRRPRLVVGQRVAATRGPQPRAVGLQQRVVLRVHEHEPAEARDLAHALEELGVVDVRVRRIGVRHEGLEAERALGVLALDVRQRRRRQRAPEPEVRDHLALRHVALLAEEVDRRHRRVRERVLDDGREARRRPPSACRS